MAKTGFCDSMPLLDLHKKRWQPQEGEPRGTHQKTEPERRWAWRLPVSTDDGIIIGFHEDDSPSHSDVCMEEEAVLLYLHGLQGLYSLQALVPGLLRHETELAMETLGLIYDRSYAWDIFSDMMEVFHFSEETLYLSVHLLNRCLHQIKVNTAKLQLLGVVCLFLAAKKEECLLPEVSELCFLMENGYSNRQLLRMERRVLTELKFELSHCSPLHFLLLSASIAHCSAKVVWMARYLLELSLLEGQCVVFLAAHLAGAALCLARRVLQEPPTPEGETAWCVASSIHVGSETTLLKIMLIQAGAAARAQSRETRATFLKYSTAGTMHVSSHPTLLSAPLGESHVHPARMPRTGATLAPYWPQGVLQTQSPSEEALAAALKKILDIPSVVVKNGSDHHFQNQLNWENRGRNSNDSGPCHVILVQQPSEASPSPASPKPHRTQARRADSTARKTKSRTYLPILKSYPRIAPHPSKKPSDKTPVDSHGKGTGSEDQSQNKRDEVSTTTHLQTPSRQHIRKQPDPKRTLSHWRSPASSHSPSPRSPSPSSLSSFGAPSLSSSDTCNASSSSYSSSYSSSGGSSPLPASRWPRRHGPGLSLFSAARDRCFLNTVGILSQSGLLDITLRTQDLLRQSNATDQVIAQLRQHTQLLYQAANNNNNPNANTASAGWERIHQAMAQSGCYPSLKNLGSEEDHHSYSPEPGVGGDASFKRDSVGSNINTHTHNWVQAPPPALPLLAPMSDLLPQYCPVSLSQHSPVSVTTSLSHSGQASAKPPETVTIMPPDSSTHGGLL
ncbi:unnamed protein product [Coregonus sp. 'balchen']|nr:unnamed protein product [Coregonus sp. 'balchen']